MIAKITTRTDFSGIVNYANNVKEKSARIIGNNGVLLIDNSTIADSFQAQLRIPDANGKLHHLSKPVKHVSIAFSPEDADRFPDSEDDDRFMTQLVEEWMKEMGIDPENTQYVIARHFDKKHPHCHLVFNRIANDGSVISDSNERRRNEAACRRIKQRHGLTFGNSQSRKINPDRLRKYEAEKLNIRQIVQDCILSSGDWETFAKQLEQDGIIITFSADEKSSKIRCISYDRNGFRISGSKLGQHGKYTYGTLCKKFGHMDEKPEIAARPEFIRERKIVFIPIVRYVEILTHLLVSQSSGSQSANREHEVGRRGKSWERIDDHIEEETTSYKFKM